MSKLHPWDLACFDDVAAVVGQLEALNILQDAIDNNAVIEAGESDVAAAIMWATTSGGIEYWSKVHLKIRESKWREGEERMNNIAQNSNEGEHYDAVDHPEHYQSEDGIECIDAIRAALGVDGFVAYCRGNAIKYAWRSDKKENNAQDLKKAAWYLTRAAEELGK